MFPVKSSLDTCLFVYGSAGTGKTLILMEALKIKLSQILSEGKRVRILATTFHHRLTIELLNNFRTKYLVNMNKIEVMDLETLICQELNIKYDMKNDFSTPCEKINRVITLLSKKYPDIVTLLLVDEVPPCKYKQTPDWRHLVVRENVIWLLGLSPWAKNANPSEVFPPINRSILTRHLIFKHRNCPQIRNFIKTFNT